MVASATTSSSDNAALSVVIGADTSKLTTGLNDAKAQLTQFSQGAGASMQGMAQAYNAASDGANKTAQSFKSISTAASSASGGTREMRESVEALRLSMTGTGDATELVAAGLSKFAGGLGGPMLLGATLAIAALTGIVTAIMGVINGEKQLQMTAASLDMPVDAIKSYSKAMIDLQQTLADVKMGFSNLTQAQKQFGTEFNVDMAGNAPVNAILTRIYNATQSESQRLELVRNAFNVSAQKAQQILSEFETNTTRAVGAGTGDSLWSKIQTGWQTGQTGSRPETYGQQWGVKPTSQIPTSLPSSDLTTQNQIETTQKSVGELQDIQQQIDNLKNQTVSEQNKLITNPGQQIIAEAQQKVAELQQQLEKFKEEIQQKVSDGTITKAQGDSAVSSYTSNTNTLASQTMNTAKQQAREADLKAEQDYQDQLATMIKAGTSSDVSAEHDAAQEVIDTANQRVASLKEALDKELENQELTNSQKLALTQAYEASAAQIQAAAQAKADQIRQQQSDDSTKSLQPLVQAGQSAVNKLADETGKDAGAKMLQEMDQQLDDLYQKYQTIMQQIKDSSMSPDQKTKVAGQATSDYQNSTQQIVNSFTQMAKNADPVNQMFTQWSNSALQFQNMFAQTMSGMTNALTQFLTTGKMNWDQFATSIVADIIKIALQAQISNLFGSNGLNIGGMITGMFGGSTSGTAATMTASGMGDDEIAGHAGGGTIQAGVPSLVGERGPEVFVPNTAGQIVNNANIGGGGPQNFNVSVVNQSSAQVKASNAKPTFTARDMMIQIFLDDINRGGPMTSGMGTAFGLQRTSLT